MARASVLFSADMNDSRIAHWLVVVWGVGEGESSSRWRRSDLISVRKFKRNPDGSTNPLQRRCYRADDADACLLDRLPHAACEAAALAFLVPVPGPPIPGLAMDVHELRLSPAARHGAAGAV